MVTVNDVPVNEFISALAVELRSFSEITAPEWAYYVKTGTHKERPPVDKDWWYQRAAAVLRTVSERGPIGVNKLRAKYGGKKNRGVRPSHTVKGSGSIARKILQQLEAAKLIKQDKIGVHKGRVLGEKGLELMNLTAKKIHKPAVKPAPEKVKESAPKAEKKPAEKTPVTEEPAPKTEKPVQEAPANKTPAKVEKPAEKTPVTEEPKTEKPVQEAPAKETSAMVEEKPAEKALVEEKPSQDE